MTASELQFYKLESENTPVFTCNNCGVRAKAQGWHMADIPIDADNHVSVVVCSDRCIGLFVARPGVNKYLSGLVRSVV